MLQVRPAPIWQGNEEGYLIPGINYAEVNVPKIEQFVCGWCGAVKGETNHWWIAGPLFVLPTSAQYRDPQASKPAAVEHFAVRPFSRANDGLEYYCGAACVTRALSKYLSEETK